MLCLQNNRADVFRCHPSGRSKNQAAAVQQRAPNLEGGSVEREWSELQEHLVGREAGEGVVLDQPRDGPMRHQHTLGIAGRAGGVHHVGQVFGSAVVPEISARFERNSRPVGVERNNVGGQLRQLGGDGAVGQQCLRLRVFNQEGEARRRVAGVHRHIRGTNLQNRQQADDDFERAIEAQRNPRARLDSAAVEEARQLVCLLVQFRVRQRLITRSQRDGVRRTPGLILENAVDRARPRIVCRRLVPVDKQQLLLSGGEHGYLAGGLCSIIDKRLQDRLQMTAPALDGCFIEKSGVVVAVQPQLVSAIDEVEEQVHVDMGLRVTRKVDVEPVELQAGADSLHVELHLNQRQPRGVALDLQFTQQRSVGVVLVILCVEQLLARLLEGVSQRLGRIETAADRKEVDAVSDKRAAILEQ